MHLTLDASTTSPSDWRYVNEGGASLVVSYRGPSHPQFTGAVLRLRKTSIQPPSSRVSEEQDNPSVAFHQFVSSRLIPLQYLPRLETVEVQPEWLRLLGLLVDASRPPARRAKDTLDISRSKAVLATDLVGGEGLAIEIKPKWGFLPNTAYLSSETRTNKARYCRYCMHSRIRTFAGEPTALGYCPLDLFSGESTRMLRALRSLWEAWISSNASVNNLRIFVDGRLSRPDEATFAKISTYLNLGSTSHTDVASLLMTKVQQSIAETPILDTIQSLQRSLDPLDLEGLAELWAQTTGEASPSSPFRGVGVFEPTMEDWNDFVSQYLNTTSPNDVIIEPTPPGVRYYVLAYLLSATFKDCSIMLRFLPDAQSAQIYVIDLDPKSVSRLDRWHAQDQKISLTDMSDDGSFCIDSQ